MYKAMGGIVGFVVGSGLAFLVLAAALTWFGDPEEDFTQYGPLIFGPPVGLFGGVIGAAIGVVMGKRLEV